MQNITLQLYFTMMKPFIYIFALGFFLISCSEKQTTERGELSVYDSISVSIDYPILSNYVKLTPYCNGNSFYVTGYNHFAHSIDFINLTGGDNFMISLQGEGPNGVLPIQDYCFTTDKIVCKDESGLLTLAMDGSVVSRLPREELTAPTDEYSVRPQTATLTNYMYLNSSGNKVFIPLSPIKKSDSVHIGKIYDVSQHVLEFLPPCYPPQIADFSKYLGGLSVPDINMYEADKVVYNFPLSSKVYLYDRKTAETEVLDIRSETIENEEELEEWKGLDLVNKAMKEYYGSRFGRVYYSSSSKKYYRIHYGINEKKQGTMRPKYLMVFDEKGNSRKELLLPSQFSEPYFFHQDVLYFACRSSNDNYFNLAKISLEEVPK